MSETAITKTTPATPRAFTPDEIATRRAEAETEAAVERHAAWPEHGEGRLRQLDSEWDADRSVMANLAAVALAGTVLAALLDRRWLVLPAAASGWLLQHATRGWSAPAGLLRRQAEVRLAREIAEERMALKALRGDFRAVPESGAPRERAAAALRAARAR